MSASAIAPELLEPGYQLPSVTLAPITRTDIVRYQGASGDMNPIHHDEPFARAAGFEAPVAVGMFAAGVMHAWAAGLLGPSNVRGVKIRWQEPVFPGDVLTLRGSVARRYDEAGEQRVELSLSCTKQSGNAAVAGSAIFVVPGSE